MTSPESIIAQCLQTSLSRAFARGGDGWNSGYMRLCFFYIRAFRGAYECTWKYRSISSNSPVRQEIRDTINEVKYGCLWLLVEGFIKVMNGLGVTLEDEEICMCLRARAALPCEQFCRFADRGAKLSIKSYFVRSSFLSQCIQQQWSVGQNYLHSELTADCSLLVSGRKERKLWSQPALACFMSKSVKQTPQPNSVNIWNLLWLSSELII